MKNRLINLPQEQSFFLFGARNTGKSTLIKHLFNKETTLYIDLLNLEQEQKYLRTPQILKAEVLALSKETRCIVIDEVQKIPALLNVVHSLIEETDKYFVLTGSSARKLKYGHANLLAGRAFIRHLYPFSFLELGKDFDLSSALNFGTLPGVCSLNHDQQKEEFLWAYAHTYLKEEIWAEHFIRKLEPFQYFLEVAAQCNGAVINTAKLSRDIGVDDKSIKQYFSILEDTLIGFHLPAFKQSFRKRLSQKSKFYFFDTGVVRALSRMLSIILQTKTYEYGKAFEHFIILECMKLSSYFYPHYRFSHFRAHDGLEIDLVVERPGKPLLMIEIKSAHAVHEDHLKHLTSVEEEYGSKAEYVCFAQNEQALKFGNITVHPWRDGVKQYFVEKRD